MPTASPAEIQKDPGEVRDFVLSFADSLGSSTISAIDLFRATDTRTGADATSSVLSAPSIQADGKSIKFRVIAGQPDGNRYKLEFRVTASDGQKFEANLHLNVKD